MKSLELQPTFDNLLSAYRSDFVGRNRDLHSFLDILDLVEGSYSIAIDGRWGSGKTFFVKQSKMILDAFNPFIESVHSDISTEITGMWKKSHKSESERVLKPQVTVYYDAWENDGDDDPLLSLVYSIFHSIKSDFSFKKGKDALTILGSILDFSFGKNVKGLLEACKKEDLLASVQSNKDLYDLISQFLTSLLSERGDRLVIFIDELDRCNPRFAVKLLERIKHYFSNDSVTFVFSINAYELQNTIKHYYGESFDACRYMDRFFDLRVELPAVDMKAFCDSLNFDLRSNTYNVVAGEVIKHFDFQLREVARYWRLIKTATYKLINGRDDIRFEFSNGRGVRMALICFVPIIAGLKMYNLDLYQKFIQGEGARIVVDILGGESLYGLCDRLLNENEAYEDRSDATKVSKEKKLTELYEAVFVKKYDDYRVCETRLGNMTFGADTQKEVMRVVSLLSSYASYE